VGLFAREERRSEELFRALLTDGRWANYIYPVCSYVAQLKLTGFHDVFAAALGTNRLENERRMLLVALGGSAEESELPLMQRVLESIDKREAAVLADWFVKHPSKESTTRFSEWASKDYFENFELTIPLAGMGDTNVLAWAKEFVKRPSEKDWLGYYVFAHSPLSDADVLARQVIQHGNSDHLVSLVQGYEDSRRPDRFDRVKDIVSLKKKSRKLVYWLRRTLGDWAYAGDKQAEALLNQLPIIDSE
jgi:hypothetical protein